MSPSLSILGWTEPTRRGRTDADRIGDQKYGTVISVYIQASSLRNKADIDSLGDILRKNNYRFDI